jgi:hypothetical protein
MRNKLIITTLISLFFFAFTAAGQKQIDSPYSRFNLGTLEPIGSFRSLSMGGVQTAIRDNSSIYFTNPASYSSLDTNSFVFDFGLDYGRNFISTSASNFSSDDINFHHLVMGFPLAKGIGLAIGVLPVSSGYYQITKTVSATDADYDPNIGEYTIVHQGNGGITKFFIGSGIKISKNLSLGANFAVSTGTLNRSNQFIFSQSTDYYSTFHDNSKETLQLIGINFDYGIQYSAPLRKNYFLNIGASWSSGNNYNSKYNQMSLKYTAYGQEDTISYTANNSAKTYIPGTLRVGVSFGKKNKFTTGVDYIATKWSSSKIPGSLGYAADTRKLVFGAEYIPEKYSNYGYLTRIEYRLGGHVGNNYLIINKEQIKEYGASIGLGLPLRRTNLNGNLYFDSSKANLFFDYTRRSGFSSGSLHREDYFSMGISINLYDFWFVKRKYE